MVRWAWFGILLTMAAPGVRAGEVAEGYELIRITEDADFDDRPRMNNCGQVVWSKRIGNDANREEIFLWDNGVTTRITNDNVQDAIPDINDHGVIVWSRAVGPGGHFAIARLVPGGEIEILTETPYSDRGPQINNRGQIAWYTDVAQDPRIVEIFLYDNGVIRQISFDGKASQAPAINNLGQIAWTRYDFSRAPWSAEIMFFDGEEIRQITTGGRQVQGAQISDKLQVTWTEPAGLFMWEAGRIRRITDSGLIGYINRFGTVAFSQPINAFEYRIWISHGDLLKQLTFFGGRYFVRSISDNGSLTLSVGNVPHTDAFVVRRLRVPGDVDGDDRVDLRDVAAIGNALGGMDRCPAEDLNGDGNVDLGDFASLMGEMNGPG